MPRESSISRLSHSQGDLFFGWHMLFKNIEKQIQQKSDVLVAFTHFALIKLTNARCVGVGANENDLSCAPTELLPAQWNSGERGVPLTLRYKLANKLFLLLALTNNNQYLVLNLLKTSSKQSSSVAFDLQATVKDLKGSLQRLLCDPSVIIERLRKELIEPVVNGNSREVTTQTTAKFIKMNRPLPRESRTTDDSRSFEVVGPLSQFFRRSLAQRDREHARSRSRNAATEADMSRRFVLLPPRSGLHVESSRFGLSASPQGSRDLNSNDTTASDEMD